MEENDPYAELASIRNLMERSTKFISLNGLSGVMAGIYALAGAFISYRMAGDSASGSVADPFLPWKLFFIALAMLALSLATAVWLTVRNAKNKAEAIWHPGSKRLLFSMAVPLIAGGAWMLILFLNGNYDILIPASLVFYGLALVGGSQHTYTDVQWLGFLEILLGLLAGVFPSSAPLLWVAGFGLLHIIYGTIMHFKYDR